MRLVRDDVFNNFRVLKQLPTEALTVEKWLAVCQGCGSETVLRADLLLMGEPSRCLTCLYASIGAENPELLPQVDSG